MSALREPLGLGDHPTDSVIAMLEQGGWVRIATEGSHSLWRGPNGTSFTLPEGHAVISEAIAVRLPAAMSLDGRR